MCKVVIFISYVYYLTEGVTLMILSKQEVGKIALLKYLLEQDDYVSKEALVTEFDISLSTLRRHIHSLMDDLAKIKEFHKITIVDKYNGYYWVNPTPFNNQYVFKKMSLNYHLNSLQFQLLTKIFSGSVTSFKELAESLVISYPYLYRLLYTTNKFLAPFFLKIDYSKNKDKIFVSGSSSTIRMLETYFFWNVTQGIEWHFENISLDEIYSCFSKQELKDIFNISVSKQSKHFCSLAVIHQLYSNEEKELELDPNLSETLQVFAKVADISRPLEKLLVDNFPIIKESEILRKERLFFNFMSRFLNSHRDSEEIVVEIGMQLNQLNNELINYCKKLVKNLLLEFPTIEERDEKARYKILYFFALFFANAFYIHFDSSNLQKFMLINPDIEMFQSQTFYKAKAFFQGFIAEYPLPENQEVTTFHNMLACGLIDSFIPTFTKSHLSIYIQFSKNLFGEIYARNQLYDLFGREKVNIVNTLADADIVISDFYEHRYQSENYFYLDNLQNKNSWKKLFVFVHEHQLMNMDK